MPSEVERIDPNELKRPTAAEISERVEVNAFHLRAATSPRE